MGVGGGSRLRGYAAAQRLFRTGVGGRDYKRQSSGDNEEKQNARVLRAAGAGGICEGMLLLFG